MFIWIHMHVHSCVQAALANTATNKNLHVELHFQKKTMLDAILAQIFLIRFERISCIYFFDQLKKRYELCFLSLLFPLIFDALFIFTLCVQF